MADLSGGGFFGGLANGLATGTVLADARQRFLEQQAEKSVSGLVNVSIKTIDGLKKAGAPPEKISAAVAPFVSSIEQTYGRLGRDPSAIVSGIQGLATIPAAPGQPAKPMTELGKLHADLTAGHITPDEFSARVNRLTAPAHEPNAVEGIRRKLATGQTLTPGEQKVYDDALKADPIARLIAQSVGNAAPAPAPAPASAVPDPIGIR